VPFPNNLHARARGYEPDLSALKVASATKLQTKRPVPNVALGTKAQVKTKSDTTQNGEKMQINREANQSIPTVSPLGEGDPNPAPACEALR
jgi:hypothetical protein